MTKASDNAFPSILITEGTEPTAPAAGKQRLYIDSTSHHLSATNSSGTERDLEAGGAPAESAVTFTDITTNNSSTSKHGYLKKLSNSATDYMDGTGAWSTPAGGSGGGMLGVTAYAPGSDTSIGTVASATLGDADATHLSVTFTAPASGNVLVRVCGLGGPTAGSAAQYAGVRESTTIVAGPTTWWPASGTSGLGFSCDFYITGVSAGSHTYKFAIAAASGTAALYGGPTYGKAIISVWAAP